MCKCEQCYIEIDKYEGLCEECYTIRIAKVDRYDVIMLPFHMYKKEKQMEYKEGKE